MIILARQFEGLKWHIVYQDIHDSPRPMNTMCGRNVVTKNKSKRHAENVNEQEICMMCLKAEIESKRGI